MHSREKMDICNKHFVETTVNFCQISHRISALKRAQLWLFLVGVRAVNIHHLVLTVIFGEKMEIVHHIIQRLRFEFMLARTQRSYLEHVDSLLRLVDVHTVVEYTIVHETSEQGMGRDIVHVA